MVGLLLRLRGVRFCIINWLRRFGLRILRFSLEVKIAGLCLEMGSRGMSWRKGRIWLSMLIRRWFFFVVKEWRMDRGKKTKVKSGEEKLIVFGLAVLGHFSNAD